MRSACVLILCACLVSSGRAATWHVPGDALTIGEAVGLAAPTDTVLIACGTYLEHDISLTQEIVIRSETGDPDCVIVDAESLGRGFVSIAPEGSARVEGITVTRGVTPEDETYEGWGGGMLFVGSSPVVTDCVFIDNEATLGGGLSVGGHDLPRIERCRFEDNRAQRGGGLLVVFADTEIVDCAFVGNEADSLGGGVFTSWSVVTVGGSTFHDNAAPAGGSGLAGEVTTEYLVDRSILAFGSVGEAVWCDATSTASFSCSDVFGNAGGDWVGPIAGQDGVSGNFSMDPLFCDAGSRNLSLQPESPCLPGQHPDGADCGLIGAYGSGCGPVAVGDPAPGFSRPSLVVGPNPARSELRISYVTAPATDGARIRVYDVAGRLRRSFVPTGRSGIIHWDTVDGSGRAVAPGWYYVRLEADSQRETRRVLVLR